MTICSLIARFVVAVWIVAPLVAVTAAAEVIVLQSDVEGIASGALLTDDKVVKIPNGRMLKVILPSGASKTIKGPFEGKASALASGAGGNPSLWDTLKKLAEGGKEERETIGAVRSLGTNDEDEEPARFSWDVISADAKGTVCIAAGAKDIKIARPPGSKANRAIVIDARKNTRAEVRWADGKRTTVWPDSIALHDGGIYVVLMAKQPFRQLQIKTLTPPLPSADRLLADLFKAQCLHQMQTWINAAKAGN